jgi:ribosomal protein L11 methyltransferase
VLAIAAAKLGWGPVRCCDHERAALEAAEANALANEVQVELRRVNLREELPPLAPTVVANLTAPMLFAIAERLQSRAPLARMVCSGLLQREADEVSDAIAAGGLVESERRSDGDWVAISFAPA